MVIELSDYHCIWFVKVINNYKVNTTLIDLMKKHLSKQKAPLNEGL